MIRVALVRSPIDVAALHVEVADAGVGAVSAFVGTVRNHNAGRPVTGIEYTAYDAMATRELEAIAHEAQGAHSGLRLVVEHRLGALGIGDASVAIVAAHAHRAPAMEACRFAIEELKRRVPIWKREHYVDGTREWVHASSAAAPLTPPTAAGGRG
jgi:molybdopterin synthase catalytic subunit